MECQPSMHDLCFVRVVLSFDLRAICWKQYFVVGYWYFVAEVLSFDWKAMRWKHYSVVEHWHCFPFADFAGLCLLTEVLSFGTQARL